MNEELMSKYTNRELSWLKFNQRVLEEAECQNTPLMERLNFVSIFNSNLDEFFMIRVGSLHDQSLLDSPKIDNKTGMSPKEQLNAIYSAVNQLLPRRDRAYNAINNNLKEYGLYHTNINSLSEKCLDTIHLTFNAQLLPLLSPQVINSKHPFPHIENQELYIAAWLKHKTKDSHCLGLVPLSAKLPRVIKVVGDKTPSYLLSENIILHFLDEVFPNFIIEDRAIIRVIRNADISINEGLYDDEFDYRELMMELIKKRSKLAPVRLDISKKISKSFRQYLAKKLNLKDKQIFLSHSPFNLNYISQLKQYIKKEDIETLYNVPTPPQPNPQVSPKQSIIAQALKKDILVNVPFESIDPINRLLEEAAVNKRVISIQTTLYRLSTDSKIIQALEKASASGINVTALVELKARFDEANNIGWSERLENSGCNVLYGVDEYKVHSKIILITLQSASGIQQICYIGTGNFNETTAKLYTDLGVITSNKEICADATEFFKNITTSNINVEYPHLLIAPKSYKNKLIACIDAEIAHHKIHHNGQIICKFNSLTDKEMIDKFYEASKAGVKIDLIIRGICCLKAGIHDLSENINVISIVGKYLEHSRIFYFAHGNNNNPALFIGSGDLMTRNTERRVEIATPIHDKHIKNRIINMLKIILQDTVKARVLLPDDSYTFVQKSDTEADINSQEYLYQLAVENSNVIQNNNFNMKKVIKNQLTSIEKFIHNLSKKFDD